MIFSRPFFGVEACRSRGAYGGLLGLVLAMAACGGADGSDVDEPQRPADSSAPAAPPSTASSAPRGDAAASSAAATSSAGPAAPSPPARAAAPPVAPASAPAAAPSPAAETAAPGAPAAAPSSAATTSSQLTFAKDIWPIFNAKCGPCHVTQRQGGHNVGSEDLGIALEAAIDRQDDILRELRSKAMPPGCSRVGASADSCVSNAQIEEIDSWYSEGSPP